MRTTSALSSLLSGACAQYISWGFSSPFFTLRNSCWPDALYSENGRKPWKHTRQSKPWKHTSLWALKTHLSVSEPWKHTHQSLSPENTPFSLCTLKTHPSVPAPWKHTISLCTLKTHPSVSKPWKHTISLCTLKTHLSVSKPWKHTHQSLCPENTPVSL